MKQFLIADSGGTKTDWCLVDEFGGKKFFRTESYHPANWNDTFDKRINDFWSEYDTAQLNLVFFGAGCLNQENAKRIQDIFSNIKFQSVKIKSDLHGAGFASLGSKNGTVAILGTGSVMFNWLNQTVDDVIGGKGHIDGDEGSGYYFGSLVLNAFLNDELSPLQKELFLNHSSIFKFSNESGQKYEIANIAYQLKDFQESFSEFHEMNIAHFYNTHLQASNVKHIVLIGSYAVNHTKYIDTVFASKRQSYSIIKENPIVNMVEQKGVFTD